MPIRDYYTCNCCLYQQELNAPMYEGAHLALPEEEKDNYIDCHFFLNHVTPPNVSEFQLKHRDSVGCGCWTCGLCGSSSKSGHEKCWDSCCGKS